MTKAQGDRKVTPAKKPKKPPRAAIEALKPLRVLEIAAQGGDWYARVTKEIGNGWNPRHPVTEKVMNAADTLTWAKEQLPEDETYKAMAAMYAVQAIQNIAAIANVDIRRAFDEEGNPLAPHKIPDDVAAALASLETESKVLRAEDGSAVVEYARTSKFKTWNRLDANKTLMQAGEKLAEQHHHHFVPIEQRLKQYHDEETDDGPSSGD